MQISIFKDLSMYKIDSRCWSHGCKNIENYDVWSNSFTNLSLGLWFTLLAM